MQVNKDLPAGSAYPSGSWASHLQHSTEISELTTSSRAQAAEKPPVPHGLPKGRGCSKPGFTEPPSQLPQTAPPSTADSAGD